MFHSLIRKLDFKLSFIYTYDRVYIQFLRDIVSMWTNLSINVYLSKGILILLASLLYHHRLYVYVCCLCIHYGHRHIHSNFSNKWKHIWSYLFDFRFWLLFIFLYKTFVYVYMCSFVEAWCEPNQFYVLVVINGRTRFFFPQCSLSPSLSTSRRHHSSEANETITHSYLILILYFSFIRSMVRCTRLIYINKTYVWSDWRRCRRLWRCRFSMKRVKNMAPAPKKQKYEMMICIWFGCSSAV